MFIELSVHASAGPGTLLAQLMQQAVGGTEVRTPAYERGRLTEPAVGVNAGRADLANEFLFDWSPGRHRIMLPSRANRRLLLADLVQESCERSTYVPQECTAHTEIVLGP